MFRASATSLLWRGLLGLTIGIIAIAWPNVTVGAVVFIFAVAVFTDAIIQITRAFSSDAVGPVLGRVLLAFVDVAAGIVAIAWPGITAEVLTIWIGIWAFITGVGEFAMAFSTGGTAASKFMLGLSGLISVALGVVLVVRPDVGAVSLAQVFGLFSFAYGIANLILALSARESAAPQGVTT
ncbi:MAG TPA: DUF308 domain-containing protein [Acidimicrobiia bacterium]|nr:DUF308 domain-containing protein [Acidimicrobiia bacterium]